MMTIRYINEAGYGVHKSFDETKKAWLFITRIGFNNIREIRDYTAYFIDEVIIEETKEWFFEKNMCYYHCTIDKIYEAEAKGDEFSEEITEHLWNEKRKFNWREGGF